MTIDPKMKAARRIWNTVAIKHVQIVVDANDVGGARLVEANAERESQKMSRVSARAVI